MAPLPRAGGATAAGTARLRLFLALAARRTARQRLSLALVARWWPGVVATGTTRLRLLAAQGTARLRLSLALAAWDGKAAPLPCAGGATAAGKARLRLFLALAARQTARQRLSLALAARWRPGRRGGSRNGTLVAQRWQTALRRLSLALAA